LKDYRHRRPLDNPKSLCVASIIVDFSLSLIAKLHMQSSIQPPRHTLPKIGSGCSDKRSFSKAQFHVQHYSNYN
ncbi:hypothetical protein LB503_011065, partial [Fusarium chuoi]